MDEIRNTAGLFKPAGSRAKPAVVKGIDSAAALGITVEPVGGSATPTLPTVASAPLGA